MIRIIFPVLLGVSALVSSSLAAAEPVSLATDAPDTYEVQRGDTLWGISGRFLRQPWRWPEVWRMNQQEIRNPHLIYPGQIVFLDRSGPYLRMGKRLGAGGTEKLSPKIYTEDTGQAIPSIPQNVIQPFLSQPLVVDDARLAGSAAVVATQEGRVNTGIGDTVFAKNVDPSVQAWQIYRPGFKLQDPETGETLGYEAFYLGSARLEAPGEPATLRLTEAVREIGTGDRMLPAEQPALFAYAPHPPLGMVEGKLISIYGGVSDGGKNSVVALSVGTSDGVDAGTVLALYRHRGRVEYKEEGKRETYLLPDQRYGLVFVFRVFNRIAYALVMDTDGQVAVGDRVRQP
ncbi:MAG: LysM peptidoglycan-binding domain-containing protein [Zoogloeaceae bacterium]|nr:LysM peptidoglycan-binding domain-containing protein [Zoogloeaceae bacterium]